MEKDRIGVLDALRGFALIGILLANIIDIAQVSWSAQGVFDRNLYQVFNYVVEQRFYVIFSLLFGTGFYIFISRAKAKGKRSTLLFVRRLFVLLGFGILHFFFQPGEALHIYAVIGFLLIPFYKRRPAFNLAAVVVAILVSAVLSEYAITLAMFLLGLFLGQIGFFSRLDEYRRQIRNTALVSLILTPLVIYIQYVAMPTNWYSEGQNLAGLVMAALYVSTFLLLYHHSRVQQWLKPLRSFGQMALTNYLGQTAIIVSILSLFDLTQKLGVSQTTLFALAIYAFQIPFSVFWLKHFRMGPFEWIWRGLTYGRWIPIKNAPDSTLEFNTHRTNS